MTVAQPTGEPDHPIMQPLHDLAVETLHDSAVLQTQTRLRETEQANARQVSSFSSFSFKLSILMPVYNEEATILQAIDEVLSAEYPCIIELIVVDDGSTDDTWILLSKVDDDRVIVRQHTVNQGKGAALLSAASLATGSYILPFDADLEYLATDIPRVLAPVLTGRCSVVYGTRLFGCNTVYQSYRHAIGNRFLTRLVNVLFDAYLSDLHTCLKLIPLTMLRELTLNEPGFGLDTEMTALLLRRGIRPFEVPVSYYSRSHAQGKKISWRDAVACVRILLSVRMRSRPSALKQRQRKKDRSYDESISQSDKPTLPEAC